MNAQQQAMAALTDTAPQLHGVAQLLEAMTHQPADLPTQEAMGVLAAVVQRCANVVAAAGAY